MATRSGRRIHSSFGNNDEPDIEQIAIKSERKTRIKRRKDNCDESNAMLNATAHYVRYPGDEATTYDTNVIKSTRKLRRHTLKEHNVLATNTGNDDDNVDVEKPKHTRRNKKFIKESVDDTAESNLLVVNGTEFPKQKVKKIKKKKQSIIVEPIENYEEAVKENVPKTKKKSKRRRNLKQPGLCKEEDVIEDNLKNSTLNKSNMSVDSFHSAASSPESLKPNGITVKVVEDAVSAKNADTLHRSGKKSLTPKVHKRKISITTKDLDDCEVEYIDKATITKRKSSRNRKSIDQTIEVIKPSYIDNNANSCSKNSVNTFVISDLNTNCTSEKTNKRLCSIFQNTTIEEPSYQPDSATGDSNVRTDSTFDKSNTEMNCTFEKSNQNLNRTFEKPSDDYKSDRTYINTIAEMSVPISSSERKSLNALKHDMSYSKRSLNSTFEKRSDKPKPNKTKSLDTTFDRESSGGSNSTFDIVQNNSNDKPDSVNLTFDKSTNDSHISINSDDSRTENIINTTPQLVESSMEVSNIQNSPICQQPRASMENIKDVPITPLKREGTYTKESPTVEALKTQEPNTPKLKEARLSIDKTPNRRKSLPSPGHTPFPGSKSSEKSQTVLNLTHSIEKSLPRASLADPIPRTTKVMFCSPVNNTAIASQIKRKVIKSNLKGSNKSFVFDESLSDTRRPTTRKRSYTQSDAEDSRTKRSKIGEEMQQSVDRLSRPRTVSAAAKLSEPSTPLKKAGTPSKAKVARTKLPNFAALHQKRFEKMESLDECQERKARRARQLLTPTGSVNILERISPKDKAADSPKRSQAKETKKHTLASLNPGYTRFGFKMNCEANPFSVSGKGAEPTAKGGPHGLTRQATLPSLVGATSLRREAAKQAVMREKSFTGKRDVTRKENRTVIKGVRTNRRFELQMKMRNIN
ncbi:unnamed protein product, partial [Iphiclides podalirius]